MTDAAQVSGFAESAVKLSHVRFGPIADKQLRPSRNQNPVKSLARVN
jgi:hypothetical protein